VERDAGRKRDRLVPVPDQAGQRAEEVLRRQDHLVVSGADGLGGQPRVRELVARRVVEAHREGLDPVTYHWRHQGGQAARVEAAREEQAEGDVAHQVTADRRLQAHGQLGRALFEAGRRLVDLDGQVPVAAALRPTRARPDQGVARRKLRIP
jgi:hypothetical protein